MTMPLVVLAYMNVFTFVIPTESGEKTGFSITIFLSFVVLLIINNDSMPENSDTISIYATFVLAMTILSTISLIVCVLQVRALTFSESKYPIAKRVKRAVKHLRWAQAIVTCRGKNNKVGNYDRKAKDMSTNKLENENLFIVNNDMVENDAVESACKRKVKRVSFMDHDVKDDNYRGRFSMSQHRETSFFNRRENTLFESHTLVRSATLISMEDNLPLDDKRTERESYTMKTVRFADREDNLKSNPEWHKNIDGVDHTEIGSFSPKTTDLCTKEMIKVSNESQKRRPSVAEQTTEDANLAGVDNETDLDETFFPVRRVVVSPRPESDDTSFMQNKYYHKEVVSTPFENNPTNHIEHRKFQTQLTGISGFEPEMRELSFIDTVSSQFPEPTSRPVSSSFTSELRINQIKKREASTLSSGIDSNINVGKDSKPCTIADDVEENQTSVADEYKMNRPTSVAENRPTLLRQLSCTGSRVIPAENDTAVYSGKSRPFSQSSGRALSAHSNRSGLINHRPFSVLNRVNLDALVQSIETDKKLVTIDKGHKSVSSIESSSEESECNTVSDEEESPDDDISWADLISCSDFVFFLITILLTTLISLAMFLTMITAY
jgi:hypothetical protein